MAEIVETPTKTFTAGAAIGQHILVKLSSAKLAVAGTTDVPIGTLLAESFADGDRRAVRLLSSQGTIKCVAAAAIAEGVSVYGKAAGKIDDANINDEIHIGISLEAAAAAGDIIEVMPRGGPIGIT